MHEMDGLRDCETTSRPGHLGRPGPGHSSVRIYLAQNGQDKLDVRQEAGEGGREEEEEEEEEGWCKKCSFPLSLPRWVSRY